MTHSETANIIGMIQEIWPTFLNGRNIVRTTEIWHSLFDTETPAEMTKAIQAYACRDTKGFPPPIGALKELVWMARNERMNEQTAWELVKKQLSGSSAHPRENFEKLPPMVQACVGTPTTLMKWGQLDESELETVIASNFKRSYRESVSRKREHDVLPRALKALYAETSALPVYDPPKVLSAGDDLGKKEGVPCPPDVKERILATLCRATALEEA